MNFKSAYCFLLCTFMLLLTACGDAEKEAPLVDLFAAASLDIIAIDFPAEANEAIISVDAFFDYSIEGLRSNGVDSVPVTSNVTWSLSDGAVSSIDENGRLSAGSVAEQMTITATVGHLSDTFDVRISAAKFDQVVMLNSTALTINMCTAQQIIPIGNYINDDGSADEQRPVDSRIINTIEWLIRNAEDDTSSQRAFIKTENNIANLQALQTGDVIIQARAPSDSQDGTVITSVDFNQTLDNNLNSIKICRSTDTNLDTCALTNKDVVENNVVSLMAVGKYQQTDGSDSSQNISAYSKWGISNTANATIALSADLQQLNVTGKLKETTTNVSVACGNVEQSIADADIEKGVVLEVPVTCANGNLNCLQKSETMNVISEAITAISITANDLDLQDNIARVFTTRPTSIILKVTADFSNSASRVVTAEATYFNRSAEVITKKSGTSAEYTVQPTGNDVEIFVEMQNQNFTVKITLPN